jgi:hypothetical protein
MKKDRKYKMGENIFLQHMNKVVICPQKICYNFSYTNQDNVIELTTNKDLTNLVPGNVRSNIQDSLFFPEVTEAELIKIINSMNSKNSTVLVDIFLAFKMVFHMLLNSYLKS